MKQLETKLKITKDLINSANIAELLTYEDRQTVGAWAHECYERDFESRRKWYEQNEAGMNLAMQVQEGKTFPWQGCSNITFPLVTIAALQFHSRAYPAIVNGRKVVDCRVIGPDPEGIARARGDRIAEHMSWQRLEQDEPWEEETDRALLNLPIVGVNFQKTYYDSSLGYNVSRLVLAKDLIFSYWARSMDSAPSITHIIPMFRNEIHEGVRREKFCDVLEESWYLADAPTYDNDVYRQDKRNGLEEPNSNSNTPFNILEQHTWLDLDQDGYAEPYIVTFEEDSQCVLRIVTRFDRIEDVEFDKKGRIVKIIPTNYFTKKGFIPNPDGSLMDIGFGRLLGPLNESVNSSINQMFDAGTLANTAGGFLGRGAKIRGGIYTFNPFGWNRVDSTGDDLRKNIYPLPVREPSSVMFNLLGFLVDYTNRISGSTDINVGENPGQNTPAETARNMTQQGLKIYSNIFKRVWRSMKCEFKKLYELNAIHLPIEASFGAGMKIAREDYAGSSAGVVPVADPTITSDAERFQQAALVQVASRGAHGYNPDAVERAYLRALKVDNIDEIFPGSDKMPAPAPDVKIQIAQIKAQLDTAKLEQAKMQFVMTLQSQAQLNSAKIAELQAKTFKLMEEGKSETEKNRINAFNAAIQAMREENKQTNDQIQRMLEMKNNEPTVDSGTGDVFGMEDASSNSAAAGLGI